MSRNMIMQSTCPKHWEWLNDALSEEPTDSIIWVVDRKGDTGKTWFSKWYERHSSINTRVIFDVKEPQMERLLEENAPIVIFDVGRKTKVDQSFLEALKYGYEYYSSAPSALPIDPPPNFKTPHIVVMAYKPPNPPVYPSSQFEVRPAGDSPFSSKYNNDKRNKSLWERFTADVDNGVVASIADVKEKHTFIYSLRPTSTLAYLREKLGIVV